MKKQIWTIAQISGNGDPVVFPGLYESEAACVADIRDEILLMFGVEEEHELVAVGALQKDETLVLQNRSGGHAMQWSADTYSKEYVDNVTEDYWILTRHV
jgi:hypothetical protein